MVLSVDRNTPFREGLEFSYPMEAATHLYAGQLIVLNAAGNAEAATAAAAKLCVGMALEEVNNPGGAAALSIKVQAGVFKWANNGAMTKTSIGSTVYIHDDQTVKAAGAGTSPAGVMVDIEADGVWVATGSAYIKASSGLLAANNLIDVANPATAAENIGVGVTDSPTFTGLTLTGAQTIALTLAVAGVTTHRQFLQVKAANYTVQTPAIDGGTVIQDLTDNAVITLPNAAAGNKGMIVTVQNVGADGVAKISIDPDASDKIAGTVAAVSSGAVANKDWINAKATAKSGDYTTLVCDGTDTWWIIGGVGVWASE